MCIGESTNQRSHANYVFGEIIRSASVRIWTRDVAVFQIVQIRPNQLSHPVKMKKNELTPKQVSSIACPTCGVTAGERCVLASDIPRRRPHVDRKLAAIEAIEARELTQRV